MFTKFEPSVDGAFGWVCLGERRGHNLTSLALTAWRVLIIKVVLKFKFYCQKKKQLAKGSNCILELQTLNYKEVWR